ncbi:hypothetical protein PNOK_0455700 [Pyrrhoderma noxium]|uniref:Uncharacterized protein n=1 Tax=Pyrrhoderma noxium TaxID=2282107 RepID=A0A286UJ21_9AGAM|nr:hypothetical protein PNOK_0455700 [Pyrrhoderma noxium]
MYFSGQTAQNDLTTKPLHNLTNIPVSYAQIPDYHNDFTFPLSPISESCAVMGPDVVLQNQMEQQIGHYNDETTQACTSYAAESTAAFFPFLEASGASLPNAMNIGGIKAHTNRDQFPITEHCVAPTSDHPQNFQNENERSENFEIRTSTARKRVKRERKPKGSEIKIDVEGEMTFCHYRWEPQKSNLRDQEMMDK